MKNKSIFPILIVLTLTFSFLFQDTNIIQKDQELDKEVDILSNLSTSDSIEYQWNVKWGESGIFETARALALDSSGNIYLAGYTNNTISGAYDMCLVKFNNLGEYQWNSIWGGSDEDQAFAMALDSSENIYLAGSTDFTGIDLDMCLVKFNSLGEYQWNRTWDGGDDDVATTIVFDSLDNIYIGGATVITGMNKFDFFLAECDNLGFQQWNHTWGGSGDDVYWDVTLDSLGNVYLAGSWDYYGVNTDMVLTKFGIPSPKRPEIPGYGLIYIIGLLSIITTFKIIKKHRNFKIK